MLKCSACGKFLAPNLSASCSACPLVYHKDGVSLSESAPVSNEWTCPGCKKKVRKSDNTPVKSGAAPLSVETQGTAQNAASKPPATASGASAACGIDVQELRRELAEWVTEMRAFRWEMADFRVSVAGISARMDGMEQRLEAVEQQRMGPAVEVAELERTVAQLKMELNERDQEALQSDLEVGHLPETRGESVLHAVTVLAAKLGVALEERDVVFAERLGKAQGAGEGGEAPRARRVVVRLARRHVRDQLLQDARVRRTLTAADAGCAADAVASPRIFLNERLSVHNRHLFHRVREECRKLQWRYSWTKRGRIYARQADGKQAYPIRSEADFSRVFGSGSV
ncbi:Zinc finger DNA binding protein [Operophtera brumata]|uniref:Zinc finger DNA binding protein n=1 Tax=Operophtera brumata TaxID=104452 RepID=A0A0L7L864_OPEBR|nr:Zinc finger DNA binding protein [Operophtera brumata]